MIDFPTKVVEGQDFVPVIQPDGTSRKSTVQNLVDSVQDQVEESGAVGAILTEANAVLEATKNARDESVAASVAVLSPIGIYNASSGEALVVSSGSLTVPNVVPAFAEGSAFAVTVPGTKSIAIPPGATAAGSVAMAVGGYIKVVGSKWVYVPPETQSTLNTDKLFAKSDKKDYALGQLENNLISASLAIPSWKRYTAAGVTDSPGSIVVTNPSTGVIRGTGYTDTTAMNVVFFNTGVLAVKNKSIFLEIAIKSIGANVFDQAVGFGFNYINPLGNILRKDGFDTSMVNFTATLGADKGIDYSWLVGDKLTFQIEEKDNLYYYRVRKNSEVWSGWVQTANAVGTILVCVRGSVTIEYAVTTVPEAAKPYVDSREKLLNKVPLVTPSPAYNYLLYSAGALPATYRHQEGWYFGKTAKTVNRLGVFISRELLTQGTITGTGRVQILRKRAGVDAIITDYTIPANILAKINTIGFSANLRDYEIEIPLSSNLDIAIGDTIYVYINVPAGFCQFSGTENYLSQNGEWNDNVACYRRATESTTPVGTLTTVAALPTGVTSYMPIHFYYQDVDGSLARFVDLEKKAENFVTNSFFAHVGAILKPFNLNGVTASVNTSTGYDYKGEPDTLMIICHGNGQDQNTVKPDTTFLNFMKANRISYATIQMQDQVAPPFTTKASGWGNDICIQRVIDLYNHLMKHYNFHKSVILCGRSMGGLTIGHLAYTKPFPIRFLLGIGPVPSLKTMFTNGGSNRKEPIRNAYGMAANGSNDAQIDAYIQGYDWFSKGMVDVAGTKYKHLDPHLYVFVGTDTTFTNEFGGTAKFTELKDAINRAGGYCYYQEKAAVGHDDSSLFNDAVTWGVFTKEMGII